MRTRTQAFAALTLILGLHSLPATSAYDPGRSRPAKPAACDFAATPGLEFQFPTADSNLRDYGFVLWKPEPSLSSEPLDYESFFGRHGKLLGRSVYRDGVRWFEGVLDDCSPVYAEDASHFSSYAALDHLALHGRVVFNETLQQARQLIGQTVTVRGEGLEPRQRLYTAARGLDFDLFDGETLWVEGIDMHRYAHAKGVGPFFLQVRNAYGDRGLIKFNPDYIALQDRDLVLPPLADAMPAAVPVASRSVETLAAQGPVSRRGFVLTVSQFRDRQAAQQREKELRADGFNARLVPISHGGRSVYKLQIGGFNDAAMAASMARVLAERFDWIGQRGADTQ